MLAGQNHRQKTIGHKIKDTELKISAELRIIHAVKCPEIWRKGPKRRKILNIIIFHKFQLSILPNLVGQQSKNHRAHNNVSHSYHFI